MVLRKEASSTIEIVWDDGRITCTDFKDLGKADFMEYELCLDDLKEGLIVEFRSWEYIPFDKDTELGKKPDDRGRPYEIENVGFCEVVSKEQLSSVQALYFKGECVLLSVGDGLLNLAKVNELARRYYCRGATLERTVQVLLERLVGEGLTTDEAIKKLGLPKEYVASVLKSNTKNEEEQTPEEEQEGYEYIGDIAEAARDVGMWD